MPPAPTCSKQQPVVLLLAPSSKEQNGDCHSRKYLVLVAVCTLGQRLLDKAEKKVQGLRIVPRELWNGNKNSAEQTQNSFSGNSEILLLTLASFC